MNEAMTLVRRIEADLETLKGLLVADSQTTSITGKISWFGGPRDTGVEPDEGLAIAGNTFTRLSAQLYFDGRPVFLDKQPPGTTGTARRLNPDCHYCAMRWDYGKATTEEILAGKVIVTFGMNVVSCIPVDFGPALRTGRIIDVSEGAMAVLGCKTDDIVRVDTTLPLLSYGRVTA